MQGKFDKFGSNRSTALAGPLAVATGKQMCYIAFDLLMVNDEVVLHWPLLKRRERLRQLVHTQPHQFEVIQHREDVRNNQQLLDALLQATDHGSQSQHVHAAFHSFAQHRMGLMDDAHLPRVGGCVCVWACACACMRARCTLCRKEGLIVKNADSPYQLNDRSDHVRALLASQCVAAESAACASLLTTQRWCVCVYLCGCGGAVDQDEERLHRWFARQFGPHRHGRLLRYGPFAMPTRQLRLSTRC